MESTFDIIAGIINQYGVPTDDVTSIEFTYDEDELTAVHLYRNGEWSSAFIGGNAGFSALRDEFENIPDSEFIIDVEGAVGPYEAWRTQYRLPRPRA